MLQSILYKEACYSGQVRVFSQRIATGEFEPDAADVSYRQIGLEHFNTTEARALALDTAVCTLSPSLPPSLFSLPLFLNLSDANLLSVSLCVSPCHEQRQSMVLMKNVGDALPIELGLPTDTTGLLEHASSRLNMVVAGDSR